MLSAHHVPDITVVKICEREGRGYSHSPVPSLFFFVIHRMVRSCEGRALSEASLVSSAGGGTWNMFSNIF